MALAAVLLYGSACVVDAPGDPAGIFRNELASLAEDAEQQQTITVPGMDGWLFFGPELRHVGVGPFWGDDAPRVSRARRPDTADALPAILDFQRQLDELDVELILVPVPPKSIVYADKLFSSATLPTPLLRLDPAHQSFYDILRREGVTVIDLTEIFLENRAHSEGFVYSRQDTHWSGTACVLAAETIARVVRERPWYAELEKQEFDHAWHTTTITGDLWPELRDKTVPREKLRLRRITGKSGASIEPDRQSPIVLLGDSHSLVFHSGEGMHATGSGLADQLAFELGVPVDLVAVRGSGATPARVNLLRRTQRYPDYWSRKRVVIWCFAAREFTESDGWSLVPIAS